MSDPDDRRASEELIEELRLSRARLAEGAAPEVTNSPAELELDRQRRRLQLILDGVRDHAISMLDPGGRIETFNRAAERIKGYTLEEVQGKYFGLFFTPEDRAVGLPETELQIASTAGRYEGEGFRQRKDGTRFYAAVSVSALHDATGALVGFVKVTQDRTRYRELSEALERREAELRLIIDAIPGLVAYMGPDERYRVVNRTYESWFRQPTSAIIGKHLVDVLGSAAYAKIRPHVAAALAGTVTSFEAEVPYAIAGTRWVRATYAPDRGRDGTVTGYVSLVLDATAEVRAREAAREALEKQLRSDAALQESTHRFRIVTRNATASLFLLDERGRCTFMNPAAEVMTGYSFAEVSALERPLHEIVHHTRPDGTPYPAAECPIEAALHSRSHERGEEVFVHKDGRRYPVAFAASPIVEEDRTVGVVLEVRDIRAEVEARDALSMQARVLQSMAEGVSVTDDRGFIVYTNAAEDAMFGYEPQELVGMHVSVQNAYPPEENARRVGQVMEQLRAAGSWSGEWENVRKDGTRFVTRAHITALSQSGRTHFVCVQADVTREKRARQAAEFLASASASLASTLDHESALSAVARMAVPSMADGCSVDLIDDAGMLQRVAMSHVDPEKVALSSGVRRRSPGGRLGDAIRSRRSLLLRCMTEEQLESLAEDADDLQVLRELGLRSVMIVPIAVVGRVLGVLTLSSAESGRIFDDEDLVVAEDVARRAGVAIDNARLLEMTQRERRRAEEANRAKDEFLSVASHELRTPLTAILGWTHMLRTASLSEERRARALETIERNAKVQVQLIDDILDVSRIITGKLRLTVAPVEPAHFVEAAVEVVRPSAEAKGVRLQVLLDPDAGIVHGDASRLQQVVWNLLSNAVKFTGKGGRVYVRVQREDSRVEIVVSDSGAGIDPTFLPFVFQPFQQQDASVTRTYGGLGLGLAIVKHLVELHGGTIVAESEGPSKGATFTVTLPISPVRSPSLQPSAVAAAPVVRTGGGFHCPPELDGVDVLVVDDEPDTRELIQAILEECKASVRAAASAAEGLAKFDQRPPDVLLSDIGMPDESGYELIRKIRSRPAEQGGDVVAVALTAYAAMKDRTRALMEGFTAHAAKPVEPQELVVVIAALLGRRRQR